MSGRSRLRTRVLIHFLVFAWLPMHCAANASAQPDTDGDGLIDEAETSLGSDPKATDEFTTFLRREMPSRMADKSRTIVGAAIGNAGGNRFVWRVEFADMYPKDNSILILYIDSDNNPQTGRKNHGCEFMLVLTNGQTSTTAFDSAGNTVSACAPRAFIYAQYVYLSYDVALRQESGSSAFRISILSETQEPHKGVDYVGYLSVQGPPIGKRPKMLMDSDATESMNISATYGLRLIEEIMIHPMNVRLPIFECELQGYKFIPSEYRADNVVRVAFPANIVAYVPRAGIYYPGFVFYDAAGREVIGLYINKVKYGIAVARWDDNNQHLFFLSKPVALKKGDRLELRALTQEGSYRTEDLVLLSRKPVPRAPIYEIRHLAAKGNQVTWVTTWPVACVLELGNGNKVTESESLNNHRVRIPEVREGETIRFRVVASTREGRQIASEWKTHTWKNPKEPPTKASGSVDLRVSVPEGESLTSWPVTSGILFPTGVLGSQYHLELLNARGEAVPVQTQVTALWPDNSIKWLLLDFRHSGPTAVYRLRYGPRVSRRHLPSTDFSPAPLGHLTLTDNEGKVFSADLMSSLSAEDKGPLRICWHNAGQLKAADRACKFAYESRAHYYPGTPWCRVLLSVGNDYSVEEFTVVQSLRWDLPLKTPAGVYIRQHRDDYYTSHAGEGKRWSGAIGPVYVRDFWQNYPLDVETGPHGTTIWLLPKLQMNEYDWANGTVDAHRLFYWFQKLPQHNAGGYRLRQGMTKTYEVWVNLQSSASPPYDRPLMAVCHPHWYANSKVFGEIAVADPTLPVIRDYDEKVSATLKTYYSNRETNREYGQFNYGDWWGEREINWGNIEYDTQHAFFLQFVRTGDMRFFTAAEEAERHNRDIDTVHYHADLRRVGKVYAHCIGHVGNYLEKSPLEGPNRGTAGGFFTVSYTWCEGHCDHYFFTGERRSLDTALKIADVYGKYGTLNYDFSNCREPGWHLILTMAVYRATGDPFYLNAARIIVERVLERQTEKPALGTAGGGWRRRMVPGHCLCEPAHYGNAGFMVGVLLTGLRWYHEVTHDPRVARSIHLGARFLVADMWESDVRGFRYTSCPKSSKGPWSNLLLFDGIGYAYRMTGDQYLADVLSMGTDSAIASMSGMGKSFAIYIRVAPHVLGLLSQLQQTPITPVAQFTVEPPSPFSGRKAVKFDAKASKLIPGSPARFSWTFDDGTVATGPKIEHTFAQDGRHRALLKLACGRATSTAEAWFTIPPYDIITTDAESAVYVEAENFSGESGGAVRVPRDRKGASGGIVTAWHSELGHWLEWKFRIPETGRYLLVFKYCTDSQNARRTFLLDNALPADWCREVRFPRTGGFSTQADDWSYLTLGNAGNPLLLPLAHGDHTIRMINMGDGLALDWFILIRHDAKD